jgi:integrase
MRTKHPTYLSGDHFVARVSVPDGKGGTVIKRFKQKVPEHITAPTERIDWARRTVRNLKADASRALTLDYLNKLQRKRTHCTIGDITAAVSAGDQTRKSLADQRRMVNQLYRVLAIALDMWIKHQGGVSGVKIGENIPDRPRIDALPATILNEDTKRRYFMHALGVDKLNWTATYEDAPGINSRLNQARDIFRGLTLPVNLAHLALPDLTAFMKGRLRSNDALPEPVEADEFQKVIDLFDGLKANSQSGTDRQVWLCNLVIRQTGMRSLSSAMQLHRDWLRKLQDGYWLNVEGKTRYQIPITDELATEILKSDNYTFCPNQAKPGPEAPIGAKAEWEAACKLNAARRQAILDEHTTLLKSVIGAGTGGQVNHRMRDTVASACYHWLGIATAQEALGHTDAKTTRKHYARRMDVSPLMKQEMRAWKRVAGHEDTPPNVLTMPQAAA